MSRGPYRRAPRRHISEATHRVGDIITVGATRWLIQQITGKDVVLEATNTLAGIVWRTTLTNLPNPNKELQ